MKYIRQDNAFIVITAHVLCLEQNMYCMVLDIGSLNVLLLVNSKHKHDVLAVFCLPSFSSSSSRTS